MTRARPIEEQADEYVLGLLETDEIAAIEARMTREPALRDAVAASRDRFVELDLAAPPGPVPARLWDAIAERLETSESAQGADATVVPLAAKRAELRWRQAAIASLAAALLLAIGLVWSLNRSMPMQEPTVIAVLMNDAQQPVALIEDFGGVEANVVPLVDFEPPEGRVIQVWTKYSEERGPVSVGLLPTGSETRLTPVELPRPVEGQLYEFTLEQAGGSPTGLPTGPVLGVGFASEPR